METRTRCLANCPRIVLSCILQRHVIICLSYSICLHFEGYSLNISSLAVKRGTTVHLFLLNKGVSLQLKSPYDGYLGLWNPPALIWACHDSEDCVRCQYLLTNIKDFICVGEKQLTPMLVRPAGAWLYVHGSECCWHSCRSQAVMWRIPCESA